MEYAVRIETKEGDVVTLKPAISRNVPGGTGSQRIRASSNIASRIWKNLVDGKYVRVSQPGGEGSPVHSVIPRR